jgi:hypothetical protein
MQTQSVALAPQNMRDLALPARESFPAAPPMGYGVQQEMPQYIHILSITLLVIFCGLLIFTFVHFLWNKRHFITTGVVLLLRTFAHLFVFQMLWSVAAPYRYAENFSPLLELYRNTQEIFFVALVLLVVGLIAIGLIRLERNAFPRKLVP